MIRANTDIETNIVQLQWLNNFEKNLDYFLTNDVSLEDRYRFRRFSFFPEKETTEDGLTFLCRNMPMKDEYERETPVIVQIICYIPKEDEPWYLKNVQVENVKYIYANGKVYTVPYGLNMKPALR